MGTLARIWTKRSHRGPMDAVTSATLVVGRGVDGSVAHGAHRQVTIVSLERWSELMAELGAEADPVVRRANLLVSGLDLESSRGRRLRIGTAVVRVGGETRPCERMEDALPGLQAAMRTRWGGGAWAQVEIGGRIVVGDAVSWES